MESSGDLSQNDNSLLSPHSQKTPKTTSRKRIPAENKKQPTRKSRKSSGLTKKHNKGTRKDELASSDLDAKGFPPPESPYFAAVMDNGLTKKMCSTIIDVERGGNLSYNGTNRLDPIDTDSVDDDSDAKDLQACRVCLQTDTKLISLTRSLQEMYRLATGLSITDDGLPGTLCVECVAVLRRSEEFRRKSEKAYRLMKEMADGGALTLKRIQQIDRIQNNLNSRLNKKLIQTDTFDKEYVFEENKPEIDTRDKIDDQIKLEVEVFSDNVNASDEEYVPPTDSADPIDINIDSDDSDKPIEELKTRKAVKRKTATKKDVTKPKIAKKAKVKSIKETKVKKVKTEKVKTEVQKKMEEYFNVTIFKTIEEKVKELQRRKENTTYINAPLKCEFCFQGYLDNETYDLHMMKHADNYGPFLCVVCRYRCPTAGRLRQHLYFRHSRKFTCRVCRFESHDKYRATLHMQFHEGKTYICKYCSKVFNHIVNLHNHLRAKHPSDYVCPLCGYSYIGERGLKTHTSLTHGHNIATIPDDAPACSECNVRFASEEALRNHLNVSSRHGRTEENFKRRNYHQLHRSIKADNDNSKKSERDGKPARKRDGIRLEKREIRLTKFDEPVPCEKCGLSIPSAKEYHYHFLRAHPNEKRTWYPTDTHPYLCDVCGKMLRNNALKDHMLEHVENASFACPTCGKRFGKRFNMRLHARAHRGDK
ncbi:hypothetical protein JYU34_008232 [Plutella xylostella]|uniref:Uncharacterized protein n=1 Tax=Plutella xylostella TaxID=51655 RepID=A0ABQ7QP35_PLUXY|nr:hypothetical protein JYU34_008232 [Plutella xylostella]